MSNYTYTVLYQDDEVAHSEAMSFEFARAEALSDVPAIYPREDLTFISTCDSGVIASISGPCFL